MRKTYSDKNCSQCPTQCFFAEPILSYKSDINSHAREIVFKRGETIFKQGTFGSKVIYIQSGLVKVVLEGSGGKDLLVRFIGGNSYFGLSQLYGNNDSKYTMITLKDTRVCMIEINHLRKMLANDIKLKEKAFEQLAFENNYLRERLWILGTKNLHGRLTHTLLYLADEHLAQEDIYSYISRKDIADISVMSVESLERLLGEMKHDRLINTKGKKIEILNLEMIKILSRAG